MEELTAAGLNEVLVCEAPGSVSVSRARGAALGEQERPPQRYRPRIGLRLLREARIFFF